MEFMREFAELQYRRMCSDKDASKMVHFIFNGTAIVNPWLDETGRFEVDPYTYYGKENMDEFARQYKKFFQ
jgi:hypothetical protein